MKLDSNIVGYVSEIEGAMLQFLASKCNIGCIVQIGCLYGRSTKYILDGKTQFTNAYLIDINILDEMQRFDSPFIHLIEGDSTSKKTLQQVKEPIEFLFIDGGHTYDVAVVDMTLWYNKIMHGGVIMVHDVYNINGFSPEPDVQRAAFFSFMHKFHELQFDDFIFSPYHRVDTSLIIQRR